MPKPSQEQVDTFFDVLHHFHVLDAEDHVKEYLFSNYEIDEGDSEHLLKNIAKFDLDWLAEQFEDNHDCNVADNDQWDSIIRDYILDCGINIT